MVLAADEAATQVEDHVWTKIEEHGSAEVLAEVGDVAEGLDGDLQIALARTLAARARGRDADALQIISAALREVDAPASSPSSASLAGALLVHLVDIGARRADRALVARSSDAVFEVAHASLLARDDRCREAVSILQRVIPTLPAVTGPQLLVAQTYARCERPGEALAALSGIGDSGEAPRARVALEAGLQLMRIGEAASAARWCTRAERARDATAMVRHEAASCVAAANALRGVLPRAAEAYTRARLAEMRDPLVPNSRRAYAGLAAAWVAVSDLDPARSRQALETLGEMSVLPLTGVQTSSMRLLEAFAHARLEQTERVTRILAEQRRARSRDPRLDALGSLVEAESAIRSGDSSAAAAALQSARDAAERARAPELIAAAALADAALASRFSPQAVVAERVEQALSEWSADRLLQPGSPFVDPTFPRRAMELAMSAGWESAQDSELVASRMLNQSERMRDAMAGLPPEARSDLDAADLRRHLADRDASLAVYVIGATRVFAWILEPAGVRALDLPPGAELFDQLAPQLVPTSDGFIGAPTSWATRYVGDLLGGIGGESAILVVPDGFLAGLPWGAIGSSMARTLDEGQETPVPPPVVLPSLRAMVTPTISAALDADGGLSLTVLTAGTPSWSLVAGEQNLPGALSSLEMVDAGARGRPGIQGAINRGQEMLHVELPLLAAGRDEDAAVFGLESVEGQASAPATLSLGDVGDAVGTSHLVVVAPPAGWARSPEAGVGVAGQLLDLGARTVLVALLPEDDPQAEALWRAFYGELAKGNTKEEAFLAALDVYGGGSMPFMQLVGDGGTRVAPAPPPRAPFWAAVGGGALILLVIAYRVFRRRRDPFEVEPPPEEA